MIEKGPEGMERGQYPAVLWGDLYRELYALLP